MVPAEPARVLSPRFRRVSIHVIARLDFIDEDSPDIDDELLRSIQPRRGGTPLNLGRWLLHGARQAREWNSLMCAIRGQTRVDGELRELVILRVGVLYRAPYEFALHAPVALAEGAPQAQVDAARDWQGSAMFDARSRDVLTYADAVTLQVQVPPFDALRTHLQVAELTATVAGNNMASRFLEALQIEIESRGPKENGAASLRRRFIVALYSVRMLAACGPLAPCLTSNSTRWFSCRLLKPVPDLISLKWANRSLPPDSGVMKPKPLPSSNHFTVPVWVGLSMDESPQVDGLNITAPPTSMVQTETLKKHQTGGFRTGPAVAVQLGR